MFKIIILFLIPIMLLGEVEINSKIKHYDIFPNSKSDLKRALFSKTPIIVNNEKYLGLTIWAIDLDYKPLQKRNSCEVSHLKTILDVTIIMPRIPKKHKVDFSTKNSFKRFYNSLYKHEKKHKEYDIQAVKEIDRKLSTLNPQKDCKTLKSLVRKTFNKIVKKYKKKNAQYDDRTEYGHKQGANIDDYL